MVTLEIFLGAQLVTPGIDYKLHTGLHHGATTSAKVQRLICKSTQGKVLKIPTIPIKTVPKI
jgi:hypothetical protein